MEYSVGALSRSLASMEGAATSVEQKFDSLALERGADLQRFEESIQTFERRIGVSEAKNLGHEASVLGLQSAFTGFQLLLSKLAADTEKERSYRAHLQEQSKLTSEAVSQIRQDISSAQVFHEEQKNVLGKALSEADDMKRVLYEVRDQVGDVAGIVEMGEHQRCTQDAAILDMRTQQVDQSSALRSLVTSVSRLESMVVAMRNDAEDAVPLQCVQNHVRDVQNCVTKSWSFHQLKIDQVLKEIPGLAKKDEIQLLHDAFQDIQRNQQGILGKVERSLSCTRDLQENMQFQQGVQQSLQTQVDDVAVRLKEDLSKPRLGTTCLSCSREEGHGQVAMRPRVPKKEKPLVVVPSPRKSALAKRDHARLPTT